MVKTGQMRRCEGLEKLGRHVTAMHSPPLYVKFFYRRDGVVVRASASLSVHLGNGGIQIFCQPVPSQKSDFSAGSVSKGHIFFSK